MNTQTLENLHIIEEYNDRRWAGAVVKEFIGEQAINKALADGWQPLNTACVLAGWSEDSTTHPTNTAPHTRATTTAAGVHGVQHRWVMLMVRHRE